MKVLISTSYGGFSVSKLVYDYLCIKWEGHGCTELDRSDPKLIEAVETIGVEAASGDYAELKIVEIPDDVAYSIAEYDGNEWVAEIHRTWG